MIKYLENRIWSLNAKIINTEISAEEINIQLKNKITSGLFADGGLEFSYTKNPIGNYSFRPTEVKLELTQSAIQKYQQQLEEKEISFKLTSFQLIINAFGFLNILPIFEYTGKLTESNLQNIEENGDASAEIIDNLFEDISVVIDLLDEVGIIKKSNFYHFGIPSGLSKFDNHTKDDSYNYLVHIFFINEKQSLQNTIQLYQAENNATTYEEHQFYAEFPIYYWDMTQQVSDNELVKLVAINSYMICETVAVNTALHVYNSFLDILNQNHEVDSNHLRKIFNYNTWMIQNLRLFNPNFTLHQFRFMKLYRQNSDITSKYELLKDAENSLTFAIEGIEVNRSQQSERIMQFILALFTALTLYSVITDVFALITSDIKQVPFSMHSVQSVIFFIETLVILSFILFFRRMSKKL